MCGGGVAQVFVALGDTPGQVAGYYSLSAASFEKEELPGDWRNACRTIPCRRPCSEGWRSISPGGAAASAKLC